MRKTSNKTQIKRLDDLWSRIIRLRGYCEICGATRNLNAHHVVGRINKSLRWDLQNGICLCSYCHKFSSNSAHNNPVYFIEWFRKKFPERYEYLLTKKRVVSKYINYEQIYRGLKESYDI